MNFLQLKIKALDDWDYIHSNYGTCSFHDYDDEALMELLKNTNNETALKIVLKWIKEVMEEGYIDPFGGRNEFPEDDKRIIKIINKWKPIIEELNLY